jgi:hypothetical protein
MDWSANREDKLTGKKSLKTAHRRAEALNRLYGTDQARPSHSVWFVKYHVVCLPLPKAMARVIGMERQMGFDSDSKARALNLRRSTHNKTCHFQFIEDQVGSGDCFQGMQEGY